MSYDVAALRAEFPALGAMAHFDSPGGTQTPRVVGEAIARTLTSPLSNRGTGVASEANAEAAIVGFRQACAALLSVDPTGIVYGRSATQLTYDFSRTLSRSWGPGDEVVVTRLDHDANVRPWVQAAQATGATVRWIDLDPVTTELDLASAERVISERTRVVAITGASNLLGTKPPVSRIARLAHRAGALVFVDAVHYAAHALVDLDELRADIVVCSPYKFLGPHCAVLAAQPSLLETLVPDKLLPSTNVVPERFELGTLPYETLAGVTAAIDFLAGIDPGDATTVRERLAHSLHSVDAHETELREVIEQELLALPEITLHSRAAERTPTLLMSFEGRSADDAYRFLASRDVLAPAGSFYAYEPFRRLGLTDALRVGLAPYTDADDVARLLDGLRAFLASPG